MAKSVEGRLRDACFTAFMRGKEEHTDWMNDVLPMVDREIAAAIHEDHAEMVSEEEVRAAVRAFDIYYETKCDLPEVQPLGERRKAGLMRDVLSAARKAGGG